MTSYTGSLSDSVTGSDTPVLSFGETIFHRLFVASHLSPTTGSKLTDHLTMSGQMASTNPIHYLAHANVVEVCQLLSSTAPKVVYEMMVADLARLTEKFASGRFVTAIDAVTMHATLTAINAVKVFERLLIPSSLRTRAIYGAAILEALRANDALTRVLGAVARDALLISPTTTGIALWHNRIADGLTLADVLANQAIFSLIAADEIDLTPTQLLHTIYAGDVLRDTIAMTFSFVQPSGALTTWVTNTRTGATTEYRNFDFNSYARMGHKFLAADSSGLYELDGNRDDAENIIAQIKSGMLSFSGSHFTAFKAAYLGMRGVGQFVLRLEAGDGRTYDYAVTTDDMRTTKVNLGKGLRARYFAFELISTGSDFDLDSIEFIPLPSQRRI